MSVHLSPAKRLPLSIDAIIDPNENPVHDLFCSVTALTSLRLSSAPPGRWTLITALAVTHMLSLESLFLTQRPESISTCTGSFDCQRVCKAWGVASAERSSRDSGGGGIPAGLRTLGIGLQHWMNQDTLRMS